MKIIQTQWLSILATMALTSASQAAVSVYFWEDINGDVNVATYGTISIAASVPAQDRGSVGNSLSLEPEYFLIGPADPDRKRYLAGTYTTTSLDANGSYSTIAIGTKHVGFFQNYVYTSDPGVVTDNVRTFDFTGAHVIRSGASLAAIGADSFGSGTVAWTADVTGDTITYITGSPAAVPEPSSTLLLGLGALATCMRRRR